MPGNNLFSFLLPVHRILRKGRLIQDLQFGLLVLQHAELRADPSLKIQDGFLVPGGGNRIDQALNGGKSAAGVGERRLRQRLLQGAGAAASQNGLLVGSR